MRRRRSLLADDEPAVTYAAAADRPTRRPGVSERTVERAARDLRQPV